MRVPEGFMRDRTRERIENYARQQGTDEITLEVAEQGIALARQAMAESMKAEHKPSEKDNSIHWNSAAETRMQKVPEGFMRDMTRQQVEDFARQKGIKTITPELVDEKYAKWAVASEKQSVSLKWEEPAWERVHRIPSFVRGMVIMEVERFAKEMGTEMVTLAVFEKANAIWKKKGRFHW